MIGDEYIQDIRIATQDGPMLTRAAIFGPFAVNISGVSYWESPITHEHDEHQLLFAVTHLASGWLIVGDLYDWQAVAVAVALSKDAVLVAAFDGTNPKAIAAGMDIARLREVIGEAQSK